jgi:hypothetical protein
MLGMGTVEDRRGPVPWTVTGGDGGEENVRLWELKLLNP